MRKRNEFNVIKSSGSTQIFLCVLCRNLLKSETTSLLYTCRRRRFHLQRSAGGISISYRVTSASITVIRIVLHGSDQKSTPTKVRRAFQVPIK